jgi:hypothetical protein
VPEPTKGIVLNRTLAVLAVAAVALAAPAAYAQADLPPPEKPREDQFILVGKGEVKGKSLLDAEVICEFRKFIQGVPGADSSRLLTFRFTRDVSADQLREVFRGFVEGRPATRRPSSRRCCVRSRRCPRARCSSSGGAAARWSRCASRERAGATPRQRA